MACDGTHQEVNDDVFDAMFQTLNTETPTSTPIAKMSRWNPDGSYNKKHRVKTISESTINKIYQHP